MLNSLIRFVRGDRTNKEAIRKTIALLEERGPRHFNMASFFSHKARLTRGLTAPGTTACIAGFVCLANGKGMPGAFDTPDVAREVLNISREQSMDLFFDFTQGYDRALENLNSLLNRGDFRRA